MGDEEDLRKQQRPGGRADRLAAELRANLARRKAQARLRRDAGDGRTVPAGETAPDEPAED